MVNIHCSLRLIASFNRKKLCYSTSKNFSLPHTHKKKILRSKKTVRQMKSIIIGTILAISLVAAASSTSAAVAAESFPTQEYGYVTIGGKGQMFYSLQSNATSSERRTQPLVIFLQGGPGASSQFSQWLETGTQQLIVNANPNTNSTQPWEVIPRKYPWSKHGNMLYVDSPLGTGYSVANPNGGFCQSDDCVANDLVAFVKGFFEKHPEFADGPVLLTSESYGGKMVVFAAAALLQTATISSKNLIGVEIGDGWVSGVACMKSYGPYMRAFSLVNGNQSQQLDALADQAAAAVEAGDGVAATNLWGAQQNLYELFSGGVDVYRDSDYYSDPVEGLLEPFMNSDTFRRMASAANIPADFQFGQQANDVFANMAPTFMKSGVEKVDYLLSMGVKVYVLSGQRDLIVDALCIERWMKDLSWGGMAAFNSAVRLPISLNPNAPDYHVDLYMQAYQNLYFISVVDGGHMLPLWTPEASMYFFQYMLQGGPEVKKEHRRMKALRRKMPRNSRYSGFMKVKKP